MNEEYKRQNENEGDSNGFVTGFFTACIIFLFAWCLFLCVKVIRRETVVSENKAVSGNMYVNDDQAVDEKLDEIETIIERKYIESVSAGDLEYGLCNGLIESLDDPYADYYSPEEWIEMQKDTQGIYYGIGAYVSSSSDYLYPRISGIIKNTPAEEAGLQADDIITEVAGTDVYDMKLDDVVALIRGEEGTTVHIVISRAEGNGRKKYEFDVERRRVESPTVDSEMKDDIGYIYIREFDMVTVDQFAEALAEVKEKGAKALVIDLRSNPGGSLKAVVDIAGQILPAGKVVYTEDKYGKQEFYGSDGTKELDIPLAVLVNGDSASASEILAGAIKDYKKGTIVGTTTYGKGIVQQVFSLKDGSAVKLTVSHYYTPNGNDIHKVGIEPDVKVEFDRDAYLKDGTDNQLEKALELLRKEIK